MPLKKRDREFPANIAADVSEERLKRFFVEASNDSGSAYRVGKEIREMVVFAPHNLDHGPAVHQT